MHEIRFDRFEGFSQVSEAARYCVSAAECFNAGAFDIHGTGNRRTPADGRVPVGLGVSVRNPAGTDDQRRTGAAPLPVHARSPPACLAGDAGGEPVRFVARS